MKKSSVTTSIAMLALAALAVVPSPAEAQSGSRLCGYYTGNDAARLGIFVEYGTKNKTVDKKVCKKINDGIWDAIKKNPDLKDKSWTKVERTECENIGNLFVAPGQSNDVCDLMEREKGYTLTKAGNTFKIEKQ